MEPPGTLDSRSGNFIPRNRNISNILVILDEPRNGGNFGLAKDHELYFNKTLFINFLDSGLTAGVEIVTYILQGKTILRKEVVTRTAHQEGGFGFGR